MTIREALVYAKKELEHIEYPIIEANILLGFVLNKERLYLMLNGDELLDKEQEVKFISVVEQRKDLMPVAYITGKREFYGRDFVCKKEVLIPRTDTETLIETALENIDDNNLKGLEIGVGTGIISITLLCEKSNLWMQAVDISDSALNLARQNSELHNVKERLKLTKSDIFENVDNEIIDFIISNPPYIETEEINELMVDVKDYEPHLALDGKEDGLFFYRAISEGSWDLIKDKGFLAFEIGYNQGETVPEIMKNVGFVDIKVIKDLQGNDRVVIGKKP